ncbi:MAG: hypothetical protein V3U68_07630, partial [Bacteroidota bacterium]
ENHSQDDPHPRRSYALQDCERRDEDRTCRRNRSIVMGKQDGRLRRKIVLPVVERDGRGRPTRVDTDEFRDVSPVKAVAQRQRGE